MEYIEALRELDRDFCNAMASRVDFTINVQVRGNNGEMLHARVHVDRWRRPNGVSGTPKKNV